MKLLENAVHCLVSQEIERLFQFSAMISMFRRQADR